jgi:hypothetical protein
MREAFDADPRGRAKGGVGRHSILRPNDNPNYVVVDLEFDNLSKAEAFQAGLRDQWGVPEGRIAKSPRARILESVEN